MAPTDDVAIFTEDLLFSDEGRMPYIQLMGELGTK